MVVCAYNITHSANVGVIKERYDSSLSCRSNLFGMVCTLALAIILMIIGRLPWYYFYGHLVEVRMKTIGDCYGNVTKARALNEDSADTIVNLNSYLFSIVQVLRKLDFAHTACANGLPQTPFPRLSAYSCSTLGRATAAGYRLVSALSRSCSGLNRSWFTICYTYRCRRHIRTVSYVSRSCGSAVRTPCGVGPSWSCWRGMRFIP